MILNLLKHSLILFKKDKFILGILTGTLLLNIIGIYAICNTEIRIKAAAEGQWYSIFLFTTLISLLISYAGILFLPYVFEKIESLDSTKNKYIYLPVNFFNLYCSRLMITILIYTLYVFIVIVCILVFSHSSVNEFFSKGSIYIKSLLFDSWGYIALVVLLSFFIKKIQYGIIQLVVCLLLFWTKIVIWPFTYSYAVVSEFQTNITFPETSIFLGTWIEKYLLYSFLWFFGIIGVVKYFSKTLLSRYFKIAINEK